MVRIWLKDLLLRGSRKLWRNRNIFCTEIYSSILCLKQKGPFSHHVTHFFALKFMKNNKGDKLSTIIISFALK